jgi:hypothetical protein
MGGAFSNSFLSPEGDNVDAGIWSCLEVQTGESQHSILLFRPNLTTYTSSFNCDLIIHLNLIPLGQICACMPAMRPLLARAFPRIFNLSTDHRVVGDSKSPNTLSKSPSYLQKMVGGNLWSQKGANWKGVTQETGQELDGTIITVTTNIAQKVDDDNVHRPLWNDGESQEDLVQVV